MDKILLIEDDIYLTKNIRRAILEDNLLEFKKDFYDKYYKNKE